MKIVLDTNVLVAGLLSPFGACGDIVRMISSGNLTLCVDARILSEYHEVLRRPKLQFEEDKIVTILDYVERNGQTVASSPLLTSLPDPDDEPFLEVAITGSAECLVTGNHAHFPSNLCQGVKVISPADFLKLLRKQKSAGGTVGRS
ncbi:MAG: putative toxin-antitoxin system toxin component, PIN family [Syntrophus sp. (in: bacteria)]|nr:putative toxin-antitoxin system toxin component, PIN family [Syntrophus sp. (in: bacteria)]